MTHKIQTVFLTMLVAIALASTATAAIDESIRESRELQVTGKYLLVPVGGQTGKRDAANIFNVRVDGVLLHGLRLCFATDPKKIEFWSYLDMSGSVGKTAKLEARGVNAKEGLALIESSDKKRWLKPLYTEKGRPQFHFSQMQGWNNDPNGMVYYDGEYHLSWQCNPAARVWSNMHWGHAVSKDLVHWKELPRILRAGAPGGEKRHPAMGKGGCYSGGATIDHNNTLGKQVGDTKTLIISFTDTAAGKREGKDKSGPGEVLAYSTDGGRTYTISQEHSPIFSHRGRDPKMFWYEPGQHWVIVTYRLGEGKAGGRMAFYNSKDLKNWEFTSFSDMGFHECPEFVELPVDGDPKNKKWALFDVYPRYQIGTFDGKKFTSEFKGVRQTMAGAIKSMQCFSHAPDGRAICMVWARLDYGRDAPFANGFTLPTELTLRTTTDGTRVFANPVKELEALRSGELVSVVDQKIDGTSTHAFSSPEQLIEVEMTLKTEGNPTAMKMTLGESTIDYSFSGRIFQNANKLKSFAKKDGKFNIRVYIDRATMEVYGDSGAIYFLEPRKNLGEVLKEISISLEGGSATIEKLKVYKLKSIWKK